MVWPWMYLPCQSRLPLIDVWSNNLLIIQDIFFQVLSSQSLSARKKSTTLRMACRTVDTHYMLQGIVVIVYVCYHGYLITSVTWSVSALPPYAVIGSFVGIFYEIAFTRSQGSEWCLRKQINRSMMLHLSVQICLWNVMALGFVKVLMVFSQFMTVYDIGFANLQSCNVLLLCEGPLSWTTGQTICCSVWGVLPDWDIFTNKCVPDNNGQK